MREDAAKVCVRTIRDASDAGIGNKPWYSWEKVKEIAGKVWTAAVQVAKITVAVLGVVALIIGGPAAWIVFAAAVVVLADTLMEYGKGRASRWDVAFALLGSVPGTKGLTTVGGLVRGIRGGSRVVAGIRSAADAGKLLLGGGRTLVRGGQEMALGAVGAGRRRLAAATAAARRAVTDPAGTLRASRADIAAGSDTAAAGAAVRTTAVRFPESAGARSTNRMAGEAGSDATDLDRAADATVTVPGPDDALPTADGAGHGDPTSPNDNSTTGPDPDSPHASGSAGDPDPGGNPYPDRGSEAGAEGIGNHLSPGDRFEPGLHGLTGSTAHKEIAAAQVLADEGADVRFIPPDHSIEGLKNPDLIVRYGPDDPGTVVELKTPNSPTDRAVEKNIRMAAHQLQGSGHVLLDGRPSGIQSEVAVNGIRKAWSQSVASGKYQGFPDRIRVVLNGGSDVVAERIAGGLRIVHADGRIEIRGL